MITQLEVRNIKCHAFHGCLKEESLIGQEFISDVIIVADFSTSLHSDNLQDTANYTEIHSIVRKEMAVRANLIEHVAGRILNSLQKQFPAAANIIVTVHKPNPPVNGFIGEAVFTVSLR